MGKKNVEVEEKPVVKAFADKVTTQILEKMGKPKNLDRIMTHHLWSNTSGGRYRVNVYCERQESSTVTKPLFISDSYFVKTDEEGTIVSSNPELEKKY